MLTTILKTALRRFVWLIAANLLGILGMMVPLYIVRGTGGSLTAERLALGISMALTAWAALLLLAARHGYQERTASPLAVELPACTLALLVQILLSWRLDFVIYAAGGATDLAAAFYAGADELLVLGDYRVGPTLLAMLLLGAANIAVMLLGMRLGAKRRDAERQSLVSRQSPSA